MKNKLLSALLAIALLFAAIPSPARALASDCVSDAAFVGQVLPSATLGLIVRSAPVTGARLGKLAASTCVDVDQTETGIDGRTWLHIVEPQVGYIAAWWVEYKTNEAPPPIEQRVAIPGPCWILSDAELGITWKERFPTAKLDAYPATVNLRGGRGTVRLSPAWLTAYRRITTATQWARVWTNEHGWHNRPYGEIGTVQQVTTVHNFTWITGVNPDGWYEIESYYNDEAPPDLRAFYDRYRINIFSIMDNRGNIFYDDTGLIPILVIANSRAERLRIDPRYCRMERIPSAAFVDTPSSRLNVRAAPGGEVLTALRDGTQVTVFEFAKVGVTVWARITGPGSLPGWVAWGYLAR